MKTPTIKEAPEWHRRAKETVQNHLRQARGLRRKARIFLRQADRETLAAVKLQAAIDHIFPKQDPDF